MKKFILFFATISQLSFAQERCIQPQTRTPVIDQDGLNTCASAVSAILLQTNVESSNGTMGLPITPSYLQLSLLAGAQSKDDRLFKRNAANGSRDFFNGWVKTCDVLNVAMKEGFCDTQKFPLDFLGKDDVQQSQKDALFLLGDFLEENKNTGKVQTLVDALKSNRPATTQLLGELLLRSKEICRGTTKDAVVRGVWNRRREAWKNQLRTTTNPQHKTILQGLLSKTFSPTGEPTLSAMKYGNDALFNRGIGVTQSDDHVSTIGEGRLSVYWANNQGFDGTGFLAADDGNPEDIQRDHRARKYCRSPLLMALESYFKDPNCTPAGTAIPTDVATSVEVLNWYFAKRNFRTSIIAMISPACADEARRLEIRNYSCSEINARGVAESAKARAIAERELCRGRSLEVVVCPGFLKSSTPFNSRFCDQRISGESATDYHAMALIGSRMNNGKKQVLVQNSHGTRCPFMDGAKLKPAYTGSVECERRSDGVTSGRFWIDEDLLFNNTVAISVFSKSDS